ncbi:hypothetical protein A9G35_04675 [Gilliamella sp. Choc5-1]|uniref:hypothetical protein n=1 Tax=Gilliamella sp. Choc5-1 TaxID=3120238 RepID=UPI00080DC869|nr:hypothetical protein [Gilliamella apicola]OCG46660.1 hypothetical protein A9G35_04675 [Gilliamella apicola]
MYVGEFLLWFGSAIKAETRKKLKMGYTSGDMTLKEVQKNYTQESVSNNPRPIGPYYAYNDRYLEIRGGMFEKSMTTSRGNANVDKFKDTHLVDYEQLNTAKYNAEKKWRTAVYDTSVSSAMNVFTFAYQYLQISGLKTNLNTLTDSAFIDKASRALLRTYLDIALTASYAILDGIKLKALFCERDKTLTDLLGKIGKAGKVLGYVAKSIAIIDSFGDLCRSMNAVTRGDPGAVEFMIS